MKPTKSLNHYSSSLWDALGISNSRKDILMDRLKKIPDFNLYKSQEMETMINICETPEEVIMVGFLMGHIDSCMRCPVKQLQTLIEMLDDSNKFTNNKN